MRLFLSLAVILPVILLSDSTLADDDQPPLFVDQSGQDTGTCQTLAAACRTIPYALSRVGKNGRIQVGGGTYELSGIDDIIYLLSGAIDVRGGFQANSPSTLIGVPTEFAGELQAKGFRVIVDSKGLHRAKIQTQISLRSGAAASDCVNGIAAGFPCDKIDLLAHVAERTPAATGADIWGFMDLNTHREYAIVAYSSGTAVVDVTDAVAPREVGFVDGQSTTWRDVKVHQFWNAASARWNAYAYVTADNASDGLSIIDLSGLPHSIERIDYASDFAAAHNVYLVNTEFSTGLATSRNAPTLILAGSNLGDGRFRAYALTNPAAPTFIAAPTTPADQPGEDRLYMHDGASMLVTDSRKDTQCVNAGGQDHCDILFDFNESTVDIWDVTNPANPVRLSQSPYSNARYTHSGWPSEDQQFLYVQDELDERDRGLATTLRVFSIADLTSPLALGAWTGPTDAIDHNGFVRGNRYYMSNYTRGLTVLNISDPASPVSIGHFDTYPATDAAGFPGNWGVYPFLPSGNIVLSDIDSGFYLLADKTLQTPHGTLAFISDAFGTDETQSLSVAVQRTGGSQGAVSVAWQVVPATADLDDITQASGTLNWADGDAGTQTITIDLANDGVSEGMERILVKLLAPTGGASISSPSITSAYISDPVDAALVSFSAENLSVSERGFGTAVVVVERTGSARGPLSVQFNTIGGDAGNGTDYSGAASGSLGWADGDANPKWIEYAVIDDGSGEAEEFFQLQLSSPNGGNIGPNASIQVNILDAGGSNSSPNSVAGSSQAVSSGVPVTLNGNGSNDPDGDSLSYSWSQVLGPAVLLSNANTSTASFTAPAVNSDTLFRFELDVLDPAGLSDTSTVGVTVLAATANSGGGGALSYWAVFGLIGLITIKRRGAI